MFSRSARSPSRSLDDRASADGHAIELENVSVDYPGHRALDDVSLTIRRGRVTAIVGANGAGKSTLIDVLVGVRRPDSGRVLRLESDRIAIVPQRAETAARLPVTVRDVVAMGRWAHAGAWRPLSATDRAAVLESMAAVDIVSLADERLSSLSGGQRQRAFLAQGLAQRADVLLLDEPATGLDAESVGLALSAIEREAERGAAVVVATHDAQTLDIVSETRTLASGSLV